MKNKCVDISVVADDNCEHEIDSYIIGDHCDWDIIAKYREAACYIQCGKCGGTGIVVNDTGEFWLDESGEFF